MRYLVEAPLRRPWHVLVPAALLLLAGVGLGLLLPARYRAVALVREVSEAVDDAAAPSGGKDALDRRSRAVRQRLLDRPVIERLLQALGPRQGAPERGEIESLLDAVRVRPQAEGVFRIECVQPDAARAAWIANLLAMQLVERATVPRFEPVGRASVPEEREWRGLTLVVLAGAVLGLALGVAAALAAEILDHTVRGPEDLAEILPLPLLATIPCVRVGRRRRGG